MPSAIIPSTCSTEIRVPRTVGLPPRTLASHTLGLVRHGSAKFDDLFEVGRRVRPREDDVLAVDRRRQYQAHGQDDTVDGYIERDPTFAGWDTNGDGQIDYMTESPERAAGGLSIEPFGSEWQVAPNGRIKSRVREDVDHDGFFETETLIGGFVRR